MVYEKLTQARVKLQSMPLKKSGENKFAGFKYFELGDFIPQIQTIFAELKLCGVISFKETEACLNIIDTEDSSGVTIWSPVAKANLKGAHDIQNLGATQTYLRRYLWMTAMELTESDWVDASAGAEPPAKPKPAAQPKVELNTVAPKAAKPESVKGQEGDWQISVNIEPDCTAEQWFAVVKEALTIALDTATDVNTTMAVYRQNKVVFEQAKSMDEAAYNELIAIFKARKEALSAKQ